MRNTSLVRAVQEVSRVGRIPRRPSHSFHVRHEPFQIQPFMIAPVLPGETMKNFMWQARAVTSPIRNPFIGWWLEYYFFYVKHRDLDGREDFTEMMLDQEKDMSSYDEAASAQYYHFGGSINWTRLALKRIVEEYFRNEGEGWDDHMHAGLPMASVMHNGWWDTVLTETAFGEDTGPDIDLDGDGNVTAGEVDKAMRMWEFATANNMTKMSYEDFLATYGVRTPREELHKPELLRYAREWSYPTNTIDPTTGAPSSAVSWTIAERGDKDRFFKEPGFVVGVTVARPKVYFSGIKGSATSLLNNPMAWLPALMRDDPLTSLQLQDAASGIIPGHSEPYWVDVRDLFVYGDQFLNFDLADTSAGLVALPASDLQRRYAPSSDIDKLFVGTEGGMVTQDGRCDLTILGTQMDHTQADMSPGM